MTIGNIMEFEVTLATLMRQADKINYAMATSAKFEEARRTFHDAEDMLKEKKPLTKEMGERINKACEVFLSELGGGEPVLNQLYDLQDYIQYNPPA